ncbi:MAG: ion transporter [Candidatus Hydrogenedentota bacterium]
MSEKLPLKAHLHQIIFEADTPTGRYFDVVLIMAIIVSVVAVMAESVEGIRETYGPYLTIAEWTFTLLFTIEYILRLYCVGRPIKYATSFFGIVDLLAVLPTYLSLIFVGSQALAVVRILRVIRVFRVLKVVQYVHEMNDLRRSLYSSRRKILLFMLVVMLIAVIMGSTMYLIEGEENGFTSIPKGIYWAIVTMTTVGYGNVSPQTPIGQFLASFLMIMGYGIIAVPTGIVTAEMTSNRFYKNTAMQSCPECALEIHSRDAVFCSRCGAEINPTAQHE